MSLEALPTEILLMIAHHIAQDESDSNTAKDPAAGICFFEDATDEHHSITEAALSNLLLVRSLSFWNFASVSRRIRYVLLIRATRGVLKSSTMGGIIRKHRGFDQRCWAKSGEYMDVQWTV
jgi:hypothetical protein